MIVIELFLFVICFCRLFILLSWAGNWILSTQKFVNHNSFYEEFPCDNIGLARLSSVNIFQESQTRWSTLRYADLGVLCWYLFLSSTTSRVVVKKPKVKNLVFLIKALWQILRKLVSILNRGADKYWDVYPYSLEVWPF